MHTITAQNSEIDKSWRVCIKKSYIQKQLLYKWLFSRWFYFHEFRKSNLAKISTSIYIYL